MTFCRHLVKVSICTVIGVVLLGRLGLAQISMKEREVLLTVTVTNDRGVPIKGLKPDHFKITSSKQTQQITSFSDKDVPVSILFLIDTSGSMRGAEQDSNQLQYFINGIKHFLQGSNDENQYAILSFNNEVRLLKEWTQDRSSMIQSLKNLSIQPVKGQTALFDACRQGMDLMNDSKHSKRVIILLSDGMENGSRDARFSKLKEAVRARDIAFYCVSIAWQDGPLDYTGQNTLEDLASQTGGMAFFPDTNFALEAAFELMVTNFRNQYLIGFKTSPNAGDDKWHPVKVEIKLPPNVSRELKYPVVRHRAGYFDHAEQP